MSMWGIVPAVETQRPFTLSRYLLERMIRGGADKVCLVIDATRSDLLEYFGNRFDGVDLAYLVQPRPAGLCDAIFRAHPLITEEDSVAVGLPDTIWFPDHGLAELPGHELSFLLFPVEHPELFDAVLLDRDDRVREFRVHDEHPGTCWVWGACRMPGVLYHDLHALWLERGRRDWCFGTLVNAYLHNGGTASARREGHTYLDVGTLEGYRTAVMMLSMDGDDLSSGRGDGRRESPRDTYI